MSERATDEVKQASLGCRLKDSIAVCGHYIDYSNAVVLLLSRACLMTATRTYSRHHVSTYFAFLRFGYACRRWCSTHCAAVPWQSTPRLRFC